MAIIGKNVIENLTTAMYEDIKIIYREYIQNSADSIDIAIKQGLITEKEATIEIFIDSENDKISIEDNGIGIQKDNFIQIMSSIADSTKDKDSDKGFRGIGRLGGISCCNILKFSCTVKGENILSECIWDAKYIKEVLNDKDNKILAAELVDKATKFTTCSTDINSHFFKVELIGIEKSSRELLDKENVRKYLQMVAPVPYSNRFLFTEKIKNYAKDNKFAIDEYHVLINGEHLQKPYHTFFYEGSEKDKKAYDELEDVQFKIFYDNNDKVLAWMWYGVSGYMKQIPVINEMRGIRLRKSNIQIGDETTLTSHKFFKEPRGSLYFIGEIFCVHNDLIPNARRDYFNLNDTCRIFEQQVKNITYDYFNKLYHEANDYKNALKKQIDYNKEINDIKLQYKNGLFINKEQEIKVKENLKQLEEQAETGIKKNEEREKKFANDKTMLTSFKAIKKRLGNENLTKRTLHPTENLIENDEQTQLGNKRFLTQSLSKLKKEEQKLVSKIYAIINECLPPDMAKSVIDKIQESLK